LRKHFSVSLPALETAQGRVDQEERSAGATRNRPDCRMSARNSKVFWVIDLPAAENRQQAGAFRGQGQLRPVKPK
jgi:hypothetical protein